MWQYDADADTYVDDDERYYFVHDARWRIVATLRSKGTGSNLTTLAEAFVYHAAGLAGRGGSSYIDSVISRDAEKSFDWTGEGDDVLDERTFYLQNWRHDVVAIVDCGGLPIEEVRYTAYGTPTMHPRVPSRPSCPPSLPILPATCWASKACLGPISSPGSPPREMPTRSRQARSQAA